MSDTAEQQQADQELTSPVGRVILSGDIEIFPEKRLLHLDQGEVKAYAARSTKRDRQTAYFALVCEKHLVPRIRSINAFANVINPSNISFVASGVVEWLPEGRQRYVFIYLDNVGKPLMKFPDHGGLGWKQDLVMSAIIKPMINLLQDFRDKDIAHGNIRPSNMFDGGNSVIERVILGECFSTPPCSASPSVFMTVERYGASPIARGLPSHEDDMYAFGVSLAMILREKDPLAGFSDEEIFQRKIEQGSYLALTDKNHFAGGILELLRGLLYDDRNQRWTIEDVLKWIEGQRLTPKQSAKKKKATRPLEFRGKKYERPELLVPDLFKDVNDSLRLVESGDLGQWLTRSLDDKLTLERVEQAIETSLEGGKGSGYAHRLLCRVGIALDPEGAVYYKDLKINIEGFPFALAQAIAKKQDLQPYAEFIEQQFVVFWIQHQGDIRVDVGGLSSRFDNCRMYLRQQSVGYGIERCLYFTCPESPCMSEKLDGYYVRSPEDFLEALEKIADSGKKPDSFLDRHIVAFLSSKDRKVIDPWFNEINAPEYYKRVLANIRCVSAIQDRSGMRPFPAVSRWVAEMLPPVYEHYHDRELRDKLKERITKYKETGDLVKIATLLDDETVSKQDFSLYREARIEYRKLRDEANLLEKNMQKSDTFGKATGHEIAAVVSSIIAAIIILITAFIFFKDHGAF
jgi:hypothetical protein